MISCPFKDLQVIHSQLQEIMTALAPSTSTLFKEPSPETVFESIRECVSKIYRGVTEGREVLNQPEGDMYGKIECDLQKQEQINRMLIKKELEFKEYQKCLEEELKMEKSHAKKLQTRLEKYNQKIVNKDIEIHHLTNQKKTIAKDSKTRDVLTMDTPFKDKKPPEGFKIMAKDIFSAPKPSSHRRRQSDDLYKRPSTATAKRMSVSKR